MFANCVPGSSLSSALLVVAVLTWGLASCELLQNGGFENHLAHWHCWGFRCAGVGRTDSHSGSHAVRTHNRTHNYNGPSQIITTVPGKTYQASSWIKFVNDEAGTLGQTMELEVDFKFPDGTHNYVNVAMRPLMTSSDGWFFMQGDFQAPSKAVQSTTFYYQGPSPGIDYFVDDASVTEVKSNDNWRHDTDVVINQIRKNDINVHVMVSGNIDPHAVKLQVLQKKKSFPFGAVVNSWKYVDPNQQAYRDFLHTHFNWAVPGNALKWRQFDWHQDPHAPLYARAADTLHGLKQAGLKIRGHNMVWSVGDFIPEKIKALSGQQLRTAVSQHIQWTMNATKGLLEHWDVNNENLHGQWFQEKLHDRDYDLELFRMMHSADPYPKLFLNDYNVVAQGAATSAYLAQAQRFKAANVHMYGLGVQCHFHSEQEPDPTVLKSHLDTLASAGVPIWATELDARAADENQRADYYERALRALYGHPAVEGIMFWSYWGDSPSEPAAIVAGDNMQLTEAGRRVLDLLENQWMTDVTHAVSQLEDNFTVRGFHGDYELRVLYHGHELRNLRQTFTLGKADHFVDIQVHK